MAYAEWLSKQTRKAYRLPTEAEWEFPARAGKEMTYWWGNEMKSGMANCAECGSRSGQQTDCAWRVRFSLILSDFTIPPAMCGSGWRTAGMKATKVRPRTDRAWKKAGGGNCSTRRAAWRFLVQ